MDCMLPRELRKYKGPLCRYRSEPWVIIVKCFEQRVGKRYKIIIIKFIPLENIILVGSNSSELYSYSDIARYYYNGQIKLNSAVNFKEALYIINQTAPQDKVILVTGSLYLCGNILQNLNPV